jgi:site-specific DNA-methyltransferase (cytosine-N4-specific)
MVKNITDTTWDFRTSDTKEYTHCFHSYPAMMIPQVARRILNEFGNGAGLLFDPYCGTGTSLVEANLQNINAVGSDINPLACMVAKAKTTMINMQSLNLFLKDFNNYTFQFKYGIKDYSSVVLPDFKNINFWFSLDVQKILAIIKDYIDVIEDKNIKMFFKVAFSETIRECSWTKNSEFKLVKMDEKNIQKFDPDVFSIIENKLIRNKQGMLDYQKSKKNGAYSNVFEINTVNEIPDNIIENEKVDIVVTSPPYGDSRTTVAYGQFSRLSNQWLGYKEASSLDNEMMGGKKCNIKADSNSIALNNTIEKIKKIDSERVKDVISFFNDYRRSIDNVTKKVKKGGYACYVVGNRTVKGMQIPTSEITKDFFIENGFKHITTYIRNIPNKRMPSENSPSNVIGAKSPTMKNEYIVICRK